MKKSPYLWATTTWESIFFFNDTATTEIYTLSLHDALPISAPATRWALSSPFTCMRAAWPSSAVRDRKSTRLNSSHGYNSYAVFCLKKKIFPQSMIGPSRIHDEYDTLPIALHRLLAGGVLGG